MTRFGSIIAKREWSAWHCTEVVWILLFWSPRMIFLFFSRCWMACGESGDLKGIKCCAKRKGMEWTCYPLSKKMGIPQQQELADTWEQPQDMGAAVLAQQACAHVRVRMSPGSKTFCSLTDWLFFSESWSQTTWVMHMCKVHCKGNVFIIEWHQCKSFLKMTHCSQRVPAKQKEPHVVPKTVTGTNAWNSTTMVAENIQNKHVGCQNIHVELFQELTVKTHGLAIRLTSSYQGPLSMFLKKNTDLLTSLCRTNSLICSRSALSMTCSSDLNIVAHTQCEFSHNEPSQNVSAMP